MKNLERELLLTLAYTAQFEYPQTREELELRRINLSGTTYSQADFSQALSNVQEQGWVEQRDTMFYLAGYEETIALQQQRRFASYKKFLDLKPLFQFLGMLPGVAGVAVTGSAAMYNASEDDDIDLMIVTENNRLWLIRPLVIFFAFLYGKRRSWQKEEKNSWCFNLWLERRSLAQAKETHSLYLAYEVCQTKWLINVDACMQQFFSSNAWTQRYLPHYFSEIESQILASSKTRLFSYFPLICEILTVLNYFSYLVQRWYMHGHMTRERVTLAAAFFHPRDTNRVIFSGISAIVEKLRARSVF